MNLPILFMAVWFFITENAYFGWNARPQSADELICDGITMVLLALSLRTRRSAC